MREASSRADLIYSSTSRGGSGQRAATANRPSVKIARCWSSRASEIVYFIAPIHSRSSREPDMKLRRVEADLDDIVFWRRADLVADEHPGIGLPRRRRHEEQRPTGSVGFLADASGQHAVRLGGAGCPCDEASAYFCHAVILADARSRSIGYRLSLHRLPQDRPQLRRIGPPRIAQVDLVV